MTRYMLDASFVIDHLRAEPAALDRLEAIYTNGDDPVVCSIATAEVWAGTRGDGDPEIEAFLRFLEHVHAGPATARLAGKWRATARLRGRALDTTDALIAATAYDIDAIVLTRNVKDFELTPVRVEAY